MDVNIPKSIQGAFDRSAHPYHMWDGIQSIPQGLEDILSTNVRRSIQKAAAAMKERAPVHMIGCGTSYFSAIAASYVYHTLPQVLATAADAFEFLAYPPPGLGASVVVGISHTGGTPSVIQSIQSARASSALTIGFTDVDGSALSREADFIVASSLGVEPALPKTRSYCAALLRHYLLAFELARLQGQDVAGLETPLLDSPRIARSILSQHESEIQALAQEQAAKRRIIVVGGGPQLATACEGALKLTESALADADAWELEEAVHGTWASTQSEDLVVILAMEGPGFEKSLRLLNGMRMIEASVWAITNSDREIGEANHLTRLSTQEVPEIFLPLFAILPIYQFTYYLALARKVKPDNMRLSDRRYLQARTFMRETIT
jgi:glucosamine--fructose-6-phosphate aminotransferase (isomerizing)